MRETVVFRFFEGDDVATIATYLGMDERKVDRVLEEFWLYGTHCAPLVDRETRADCTMYEDDLRWLVKLVDAHPSLLGKDFVRVFNQFRRGGVGDQQITIQTLRKAFKATTQC